MSKKYEISFIIPALNEEEHVGGVINSIKRNMDDDFKYEVIVVDNGSNDRTIDIAKESGAQVFCKPELTIAALRNFGAAKASYNNIVFLDADVYLRENWREKIKDVIEKLNNEGDIITGSVCGLRDNASWLERYWWGPKLRRKEVPYINSGHFIITKAAFEKLGGFNEKLMTGEDPELCQRARNAGFKIVNNPELEVVHEGYPRTVRQFFRRERWHGRGGFVSFKDLLRSKAAFLSIVQLGVFIFSIAITLMTHNLWFLTIYLLFMLFLCGSAAFYRCRKIDYCLGLCAFLYGIYFIARTHSFIYIILKTRSP